MSYILDALRKADAQRERDPSRGIHAHPTPLGGFATQSARPAWVWGAGAIVVALVAWGGWMLMQDKQAAPAAPPVVANAVPAPVPVVVASAAPSSPPPAANVAPAAVIVPPPPPVSATPATDPAPMRTPPQPRQTGFGRQLDAPQPGPSMQPPPMQAPSAAPVGAPVAKNTPAPAVSGLPPDAPRVSISGGVYSPDPAQRMLIVNGQVYNEGSEVAPGLAIDEIKARTAVLKFRGARYTVTY